MLYLYRNEVLQYISILDKPSTTTRMILFGSVARNNYRPNSDIDILIETNSIDLHVEKQFWKEIQGQIYLKYNIAISFIVINNIENLPSKLKQNIKKEGKVIWEK